MNEEAVRRPILAELYQQFLADQETADFVHRTTQRYTVSTLARLVATGERLVRRAAVLALGFLGDYEMNPVLGAALRDADRGVRLLAETAIRSVWCRAGTPAQRKQLNRTIGLNRSNEFTAALRNATALIREAPWLAEVWNQRAIAHFGLERYDASIHDCRQALEINPYHFGAAAGMGQCYLRVGKQAESLDSFRRALALNPELEGVRANVQFLERELKRRS